MDRKRKTKKINLLDLFSGIGGFSLGIQQAAIDIGWHGYSEIDKYANEILLPEMKKVFPKSFIMETFLT